MSLPNWTKQFKILVVGVLVTIIILGICRWVLRSGTTSTNGPRARVTAALPSQDKERISFNEKTHTLTIQTATKTTTEYAKNPDIQIQKDETVKINRHLSGFENNLFIGAGYGDTGRIFVGDNVFHFSRFDLMGAVGWTPNNQYPAVKAFAGVSYAVYSNTSVGVCVNLDSIITKNVSIGGFVSVRL